MYLWRFRRASRSPGPRQGVAAAGGGGGGSRRMLNECLSEKLGNVRFHCVCNTKSPINVKTLSCVADAYWASFFSVVAAEGSCRGRRWSASHPTFLPLPSDSPQRHSELFRSWSRTPKLRETRWTTTHLGKDIPQSDERGSAPEVVEGVVGLLVDLRCRREGTASKDALWARGSQIRRGRWAPRGRGDARSRGGRGARGVRGEACLVLVLVLNFVEGCGRRERSRKAGTRAEVADEVIGDTLLARRREASRPSGARSGGA